MNMICNDKSLRKTLLEKLQRTWPNIQVNKLPKNRNEILFCSDKKSTELYVKNPFNLPSTKNKDAASAPTISVFGDKTPDRKALEMLEEVSSSLVDLKLD